MRKNLYELERIEKFLEGSLTAAEKVIFQNNLATDIMLRSNVEAIELLRTATKRRAIRQKIAEIENNQTGTSWGGVIGVLAFLAIGTSVFFLWPNKVEEYSYSQKNKTETNRVFPMDSIINESSETAILTSNDIKTSNLSRLKTWVEPSIQNFSFDSKEGAFIQGKNGIIVVVPKDAFINDLGKQVAGLVDFQLIEALGIEEMVLYGLKTVSPDGQLASGGMFYLNAEIDGKEVKINPSRPLYIEISNPQLEAGMMAFEGKLKEDGDLSWENPRPLKKPLVTLPFEELDFLPEGFERKVQSMMPVFGYQKATEKIIDSLYYSLNWNNFKFEEDAINTVDGNIQGSLADSESGGCGINPTSIEAVLIEKFKESFIATKDFERRVKELHSLKNGQELFDIYLTNLQRDLYISDSICSRLLKEKDGIFRNFYLEKGSNVKSSKIYAGQLKQHYITESRKLREQKETLYNAKIKELRVNSNAEVALSNTEVAALRPSPNYITQWFTMGWGNIDRYFKELSRGSNYVNINVENSRDNLSVTAWLPNINTYTDLNESMGKYRAFYPSSFKRSIHVFAIAKSGDQFFWDLEKFKPSQKGEIELNPKLASVEMIKADLAEIGESWGRINRERARIENERASIQQNIQSIYRLNDPAYNTNRIVNREEYEHHRLICQLKSTAFPCDCEQEELVIQTVQAEILLLQERIFTIVEEMPSFPGEDNELKKYLDKNVKYPSQALESKIEGTVFVSFIVRANGKISRPEIIRSLGYGCDEEALNAISKMPRWTPGRQRGRVVDVQYTMPVTFSLQKDKSF